MNIIDQNFRRKLNISCRFNRKLSIMISAWKSINNELVMTNVTFLPVIAAERQRGSTLFLTLHEVLAFSCPVPRPSYCCRAPARQHTILDVTRSSCFFVSSSPAELYLVEISICAVEMSAIPGEN